MAKGPMSPLGIANLMAGAAHKKAQPKMDADGDYDGDVAPAPKTPGKKMGSKQAGAIAEKKKGGMPPKV